MASHAAFRLFLTIFVIVPFSGGHFDFDELNSIHYGIEIMGTPVIAEENTPAGSVMLTSIYGQAYQCAYPDQQAEVEREKEEEKNAEELGISHLLKPMESSPCLIHSKDWWTYEFCYGTVIKQYHMENGVPTGEVINLGFYESEFDWNNETEQSRKNRLNRYHSQQYVNGTACDLTGNARRAEVRFQCEDGVGDYIARIDETATCVYILTIRTTKICHHPYLKPPVTKKPLSITCNPLLSAEEYADYQTDLQAKKERRERFARQAYKYVDFDNPGSIERTVEEQTAKWAEMRKQAQMEKEKMEENGQENAEEDKDTSDEEGITKKAEDTQSYIDVINKPGKEMTIIEETKKKKGSTDDEVVNKMADEIQKVLIETLAKELQGQFDEAGQKDDELLPDQELPEDNSEEKEEEEDDEEVETYVKVETLEGSDLKKTFSVPQDGVERDESDGYIKIKLKPVGGEHQQQNVDGITEVEADDQKKLPESEETGATAKQDDISVETDESEEEFEKGLAAIRRKRRLARLAKYKETLNSAMQAQFSNIVDEATQELQNEGMEGEVNRPEAFKQLATTLSKLLSRLERTEEDIHTIEERIASKVKKANQLRKEAAVEEEESETDEQATDSKDIPKEEDLSKEPSDDDEQTETSKEKEDKKVLQSESGTPRDGRVKVRITRIKQSPDGNTDTESLKSSGPQLKIPQEQKEQLENSVQQELQKAGLDQAGGKVEVRIITAGYYDKNDDSVHLLSEEDSSAFNRMIVTILSGSAAEEKESERQKKLQENYGFTWNKDKKQKTIIPPQ